MNNEIINVDFCFQYEVKVRELENICLVATKLQSIGYSVAIIHASNIYLNMTEYKYACKVLIIHGGKSDYSIQQLSRNVLDFNYIVDMQWEQIPSNRYLTTKDINNSLIVIRDKAKYIDHISWGNNNVELAVNEYGVPAENMKLCGNLSTDFMKDNMTDYFISKEELFDKYNLNKYKKVSLFISSFAWHTQPKYVCETHKNSVFGNVYDYMKEETSSQKGILSWFIDYLIQNPDEAIVYRPHPVEINYDEVKLLDEKYPNFHVIMYDSIKPWIIHCDKVYTWKSTSIVEVFAAKKSCYILNPTNLSYDNFPAIYDGAECIRTFDEFCESQKNEEYYFPIQSNKFMEFYCIDEVPVYIKIANTLIDILNSNKMINADIKEWAIPTFSYFRKPENINGIRDGLKLEDLDANIYSYAERRKYFLDTAKPQKYSEIHKGTELLDNVKRAEKFNRTSDDEIKEIMDKLRKYIK